MAIHVVDPKTDAAVRRLARLTGQSLTETIRKAVEAEYSRRLLTPDERVARLQAKYRAIPEYDDRPLSVIRDELNDGL